MSLVMDRRTMRPILSGPTDLLSQIQTPTLAWGDIKANATPWYSDAGATPAVVTNAVQRATELIAGTNFLNQNTAGFRPTLASWGGHTALAPDGNDWLLSVANIAETGDAEFELTWAGQIATSAGNQAPWMFGGTGGLAGCMLYVATGTRAITVFWGGANSATFGTLDTDPHVVRVLKTAGAINATTRVWVDGVERTVDGGGSASTPNLTAGTLIACDSSFAGSWGIGSGGYWGCLCYYASAVGSARAADDAAIANWYGI